MGKEIRVSVTQRLDVPNFFIDIPNFLKDVPYFLKDVPNLFKNVPKVPKSIPRWGTTFNDFPRVPKKSNGP